MVADSVLVELPGDRLYPEECRLQTFTFGDASTLSLLPKTQDTRKLFNIVDKRMNFDVKLLTLKDFWFILYWERINSYSSFPVKLPWTCSLCEHKNYDELSGSDLIIDDVDPEYHHGMELDFPDSGPLKLRLKTVGDELNALKYIREKQAKDVDEEFFDALLTAGMLEYNGGTLEERVNKVINMSSDDQFLIRAFENEFDYGVKDYSNFTCEGCKEVVKVRYKFDLTNFFPSIQDQPDVRSRILSSKASVSTTELDRGRGSDEVDLHKGDARKKSKSSTGETKSNESSDASQEKQEKIELTPEELQIMIQKGIEEATTKTEDKYSTLDEVTKGR